MTQTIYTIHERENSYQTTDTQIAEAYSRAGLEVTAQTGNVTQEDFVHEGKWWFSIEGDRPEEWVATLDPVVNKP